MLSFPLINKTDRKIIHIDMDAFFASVEERDNPVLRNEAVIIGADPRKTGGRGVVSTCNYKAREFGVHSAMSSKEAFERCPQAIFISGNYQKYRKVGMQIREIFNRYTELVEPMSIDEAYLDVTDNKFGIKSAIKIAKMIQYDIWKETHLTCSAGVSYNKFLAKLASDFEKPKGLTVILPDDAQDFLKKLPIDKFHGVGKRSVEKLHQLGVFTGSDLLEIPEMTLIDLFGRFGYDLYRKARGISNSPVKSNRIRKSIGSERTYARLLYDEEDIKSEISKNVWRVVNTLKNDKKTGRTVILKVRYSDFSTLTKQKTLDDVTNSFEVIDDAIKDIYNHLEESRLGIRLLGVTVTGLEDDSHMLTLFSDCP